MGWKQFYYAFDGEVERAMRYAIHEAMREECRSAGGGTTEGVAENAIERFKRKMEKHTGRPAITGQERPCGTNIGAENLLLRLNG